MEAFKTEPVEKEGPRCKQWNPFISYIIHALVWSIVQGLALSVVMTENSLSSVLGLKAAI